jgi:hypothetical protein
VARGQPRAVGAQVVAGGLEQVGLVLLAEPVTEAPEMRQVQAGRPGRNLLVGQGGQEHPERIIGRKRSGFGVDP